MGWRRGVSRVAVVVVVLATAVPADGPGVRAAATSAQPSVSAITAVFTPASSEESCFVPRSSECLTNYSITMSDPDSDPLTSTWSMEELNDDSCTSTSTIDPTHFIWWHAEVDGCSHFLEDERGHQGIITVEVTDGQWTCTATYRGTISGTGLPPTCTDTTSDDPLDPKKPDDPPEGPPSGGGGGGTPPGPPAPPTNGVDIEVVKTAKKDSVRAGRGIRYTITVTNHGPEEAPKVDLFDKLKLFPDRVARAFDLPGGCEQLPNSDVHCVLEKLRPGESRTITFGVETSELDSDIIDTATVAAGTGTTDINPSNNASSAVVHVRGRGRHRERRALCRVEVTLVGIYTAAPGRYDVSTTATTNGQASQSVPTAFEIRSSATRWWPADGPVSDELYSPDLFPISVRVGATVSFAGGQVNLSGGIDKVTCPSSRLILVQGVIVTASGQRAPVALVYEVTARPPAGDSSSPRRTFRRRAA